MPSSSRHTSRVVAVMACVVTLVLAGFALAGAATGPNTDHITVTQVLSEVPDVDPETDEVPAESTSTDTDEVPAEEAEVPQEEAEVPQEEAEVPQEPECVSRDDGLSMAVEATAESYTVVLTVSQPLCNEIEASAVIYLMPSGTTAWPQALSEKVDFTLQEPGVTTIVFSKYCVPAQFDVLTGDTPDSVAPWLPQHGPLVFPNNLEGFGGSAFQYQAGGDCLNTTTTVPASVGGVTTTVVGGSIAPAGVVSPTVAGTTAANSGGAGVSVAG